MYGCPHCKTWLHEECVQEDIKRKAFAKVLEEEGEEAVRKCLAAIHIDAPAQDAKPPPKKRGRKPHAAANGKKGAKAQGSVDHPSVEQLDKMFEVVITVNSGGQATRAVVKDIRPKKGGDEGEEEEDEEEEEEEEIAHESDHEGDNDGLPAIKKEKRRKPRRVWEEDVLCLLCSAVIY